MPQPLIGIIASREEIPDFLPHVFAVMQGDAVAVHQAGGVPLCIPPLIDDGQAEKLAARLDGLYLAGGGDVSARYSPGVENNLLEYTDEERDRVELALLRAALARDIPVLAICRGLQVLNVALGGTLVDDLSTRLPDVIKHKVEKGEALDASSHTISLVAGSRLATIYDKLLLQVNSFHHQGIFTLGLGLTPIAAAPDGLIEAVEHPDYRFCLGVQWHPEYSIGCEPGIEKIFSAFIAACGQRL